MENKDFEKAREAQRKIDSTVRSEQIYTMLNNIQGNNLEDAHVDEDFVNNMSTLIEKFKEAFANLSLDEKRNQISNELLVIAELIKFEEKLLKIPSTLSVKNYQSNSNMTESEMLDFLYEDIYNIQKELITILLAHKQ